MAGGPVGHVETRRLDLAARRQRWVKISTTEVMKMTRFWKLIALTSVSGGYLMQVCAQKDGGFSFLPNTGSMFSWSSILAMLGLGT